MPLNDQEAGRSDSRIFNQPCAEYMDLKEIRRERNTEEEGTHEGVDYAPLHPSTRSWEVPRDHVSVKKIIGKGAFGQVAKGTAEQLRGRLRTTTVAIKMLKSMILLKIVHILSKLSRLHCFFLLYTLLIRLVLFLVQLRLMILALLLACTVQILSTARLQPGNCVSLHALSCNKKMHAWVCEMCVNYTKLVN